MGRLHRRAGALLPLLAGLAAGTGRAAAGGAPDAGSPGLILIALLVVAVATSWLARPRRPPAGTAAPGPPLPEPRWTPGPASPPVRFRRVVSTPMPAKAHPTQPGTAPKPKAAKRRRRRPGAARSAPRRSAP